MACNVCHGAARKERDEKSQFSVLTCDFNIYQRFWIHFDFCLNEIKICVALNCYEHEERITFDLSNRLLEAAKNESVVRSQDLFTLVRYVSYNPVGQSMAWDWTTLNWDYLVNRSVKPDLFQFAYTVHPRFHTGIQN